MTYGGGTATISADDEVLLRFSTRFKNGEGGNSSGSYEILYIGCGLGLFAKGTVFYASSSYSSSFGSYSFKYFPI